MTLPILIGIILAGFATLISAESIHIVAGISSSRNLKENYQKTTDQRSCDKIVNYAVPGTSRELSEMLLVCQALRIGGIEPIFELKEYPVYMRMLLEVTHGNNLIMLHSTWLSDVDQSKVFVSDPLIRKGEFELGIFTRPDHKELLKVKTLAELSPFIAISNIHWNADWAALKKMQIKTLNSRKYGLMFKMVNTGRADFMLNSFSSLPDMSVTAEGIKLIPVPGIKIGLSDSRHILVNKRLPNAKKVFDALQKGLKVLRKNGSILRAYQESGFINPRVKDCLVICCE